MSRFSHDLVSLVLGDHLPRGTLLGLGHVGGPIGL